jgi:thiol:disulfide interchange protein DsbD
MNLTALIVPLVLLFQPPAAPKFTAKLYAAHDALAPGAQTELAIEIEVEKDWHVYDPIIVDTGAPTIVAFAAPAGLSFGELRFPTPAFAEQEGIGYLAHEGKFVVLTTLSAAADAPPGDVVIVAKVTAFACKELCVPVEAEAKLTLPIRAGFAQPAHAALLKSARENVAPPLAEAEYLAGASVSISQPALALNDEAEIVLKYKVASGHHIQDRDPGNKDLIGSRLYVEKIDGLKLGEQIWPAPKIKNNPVLGRIRELAGQGEIRVPIRLIDPDFAAGPVAIRVLFTYQACTDEGTCYPPVGAVGVVRFEARTDKPPLANPATRGTLMPVVTHGASAASNAPAAPADATIPKLLTMLLLGFVGGLILNIMPCVFPVISLKILGFVKQSGEDRARILRLGLVFALGVLTWFWVFAYLTTIGQVPLQHPLVAMALTAVLVVFALNLFGVFEIILPGAAADTLGGAASREGYPGAFFNGFLATLLGTACTAPFFATAAAFAATQPKPVAFAVFTAAGLGMASPYLLLSAFPGWLRLMPRPGPWMTTFKQAMGFVLLGTAVWLLLVVGRLLDVDGVIWTVCFLCFLAFALWLVGRIGFNWSSEARAASWAAAFVVVAAGYWLSFVWMYDLRAAIWPPPGAPATRHADAPPVDLQTLVASVRASDWSRIPWQPYRQGLADELSRKGYTVYVDYTAAWCFSCQANKLSSLDIPSTREKMRSLGVIPIEADYTRRNADMKEDLLAFGHNGVPLNLVYPPGNPAGVEKLPVILTPDVVQDALKRAGPSIAGASAAAPAGDAGS